MQCGPAGAPMDSIIKGTLTFRISAAAVKKVSRDMVLNFKYETGKRKY